MKLRWKIIIIIFFAMLAVQLFGAQSDAALRANFEYFNEQWFDNKLPKDVLVHYSDLTVEKEMGVTDLYANGAYVIRIDRKTNPIQKTADFTLLHEMCHVKIGMSSDLTIGKQGLDTHGPLFQSCMLDLAGRGAFKDLW